MITSKMKRVLSLTVASFVLVLVAGNAYKVRAQCNGDPFCKPPYARKPNPNGSKEAKKPKKGPYVVEAPSIEARIDHYKRIRQQAALRGEQIPKVTSVLLLNEMTVTGIFKTPRGYAAMVEAKPIKLSYTIYPGERFFDGQLVAVEENRLVFRKVTKWSNSKFVSSVENKPLRRFSMEQEVQGTAITGGSLPPATERAAKAEGKRTDKSVKAAPSAIVSPLDEMRNQPPEAAKDKKSANKKKTNGRSVKKGRQ